MRNADTITSGDIFAARTLETRFVLNESNRRSLDPKSRHAAPSRNLVRRGRSHFPKRRSKRKRKRQRGGKARASGPLLRYQKRRPSVLIQEKTRRLHGGWLQTHLWHAKRCRMGTVWGYKLSLSNLQHAARSMRSTLNQLRTSCTLHDASYWNAIALCGTQRHLMALLVPHIAPFQHGLLRSEEVLSGHRESEFCLYDRGRYPLGFECAVRCSFDAVPLASAEGVASADSADSADSAERDRVCWLWCHAAVFSAVIGHFKSMAEGQGHGVEVRDESRKFVRFEVRGPTSSLVVAAASECQVPVLMDKHSDRVIGDGDCLTSTLPNDPRVISAAQPFVFGDKTGLRRSGKCLRFQLKHDFVLRHSPMQHPAVLVQRYRACSSTMTRHFHRHWHSEAEGKSEDVPTASSSQFAFKMVARRFYDENGHSLESRSGPKRRVVGWDIIIPIHAEPRRARFWWRNLHFAGGRVIGMEQKEAMRLEMGRRGRLFPIDYLDGSASIHYWLKHRKYAKLKELHKRPRAKRARPLTPRYPFAFWPNVLFLVLKEERLESMRLHTETVRVNMRKLAQLEGAQQHGDGDGDGAEPQSRCKEEAQFLLNHTLFGLKHDSPLMRRIAAKLHLDHIDQFGGQWLSDPDCRYFIVRDEDVLQRIAKREPVEMEQGDATALLHVDIQMCSKGVPTTGSPLFADDALIGIVVDGAYSAIAGKGIGMGLVVMDKLVTLYAKATADHGPTATLKSFGAFPNHSFQCHLKVGGT